MEEIEVLKSIYDGDESFKFLDNAECTVIQYFFGEKDESKSFLIEFRWPADYPMSSALLINLNLFYNKHLINEAKEKILNRVNEEVEKLIGSSMTFSIIEFIKENFDDLLSDQPLNLVSNDVLLSSANDSTPAKASVEKKEQLSKAQKRKMWDRGEGTGEKERGWNWVDVVKHLSQTGGDSHN